MWGCFVPPGRSAELRELYAELHANSVTVPGAAVERLGRAARETRVAVGVGVNEREPSGGDGTLAGLHRKLVPTDAERLVWGRGDGSDLQVHPMPFARVSGLICCENYMPLARYVLAARGVEVYPAPTWDRGEPRLSSMRHVAKETRSVVVGCCTPVRKDHVPDRAATNGCEPAAVVSVVRVEATLSGRAASHPGHRMQTTARRIANAGRGREAG